MIYRPAQAVAQILSGEGNFTIVRRYDPLTQKPRVVKGTEYLNIGMTVDGVSETVAFSIREARPWRNLTPIEPGSTFNSVRIPIKKSESGPNMWIAMEALNTAYLAEVAKMRSDPIKPLILVGGREPTPLWRNSWVDEITGEIKETDDPTIWFNLAFGNYPTTYPIADFRDTPRCVILDWDKVLERDPITDEPISWAPFQVNVAPVGQDPQYEPVTLTNVHKAIGRNTMIMRARVKCTQIKYTRTNFYLDIELDFVVISSIPDAVITEW